MLTLSSCATSLASRGRGVVSHKSQMTDLPGGHEPDGGRNNRMARVRGRAVDATPFRNELSPANPMSWSTNVSPAPGSYGALLK